MTTIPSYLRDYKSELAGVIRPDVFYSPPTISPIGGTWVVTDNKVQRPLTSRDGGLLNSVELVVLSALPNEARDYYETEYDARSAPVCFSFDNTWPDANAAMPQAESCAVCPKNQWGSRSGDGGSSAKACRSAKLLVVGLYAELRAANERGVGITGVTPRLLRVRTTSFKNLVSMLDNMDLVGIPPEAWVAKCSINASGGYPILQWEIVKILDEGEFELVKALLRPAKAMLPTPTPATSAAVTRPAVTGPAQVPAVALQPEPRRPMLTRRNAVPEPLPRAVVQAQKRPAPVVIDRAPEPQPAPEPVAAPPPPPARQKPQPAAAVPKAGPAPTPPSPPAPAAVAEEQFVLPLDGDEEPSLSETEASNDLDAVLADLRNIVNE